MIIGEDPGERVSLQAFKLDFFKKGFSHTDMEDHKALAANTTL